MRLSLRAVVVVTLGSVVGAAAFVAFSQERNPRLSQIKTAGGQLQTVMKNGDFGFYTASEQAEVAHGMWNIVEVIVNGADEAKYMVNGKQVNAVYNMKRDGQPLTEGRISVQAEYAELFYRNIKYKIDP